MTADDADSDAAKARVAATLAKVPADELSALPKNDQGEPIVEVVHALYTHERTGGNEVSWTEVRELHISEWEVAISAHADVYRLTRGLDVFPSFAWGELQIARGELLRQLARERQLDEWIGPLIEYRVLSFSTALKLYYEQVVAEASGLQDGVLAEVKAAFSEVYDRSFGYRLVFSMRNAFQHGTRDLLTLRMAARLVDGTDDVQESEAFAYLKKEVFAAGRSNAAVRQQVRETREEIDLFELSEEAFLEIQELHARLTPLLHPRAADAAKLIMTYMKELGGQVPRLHEYVRGLPLHGILGIVTLDRIGFDYVVAQSGGRTTFEEGLPPDVMSVLPRYMPHEQTR